MRWDRETKGEGVRLGVRSRVGFMVRSRVRLGVGFVVRSGVVVYGGEINHFGVAVCGNEIIGNEREREWGEIGSDFERLRERNWGSGWGGLGFLFIYKYV
jgi:hypothetical protein